VNPMDMAFPVLAGLSRDETMRAMRWVDRKGGFEQLIVVLLSAAAIIALIVLATRLIRYFLRAVREADSSRGLYEHLVTSHRLSASEEKLLRGLATRLGEQPIVFFVKKSLLEQELRRRPQAELKMLMRKLFG